MKNSIESAILNFKPAPVEGAGFIEEDGDYVARILSWHHSHSMLQYNGEAKSENKLPPFKDPTAEVVVLFGTDKGNAIFRGHIKGYSQWGDLTDSQKSSGKYEKVAFHDRIYACKKDDKGNLVRVENAERTAQARNFLNQLFAAIGQTNAETLKDALDKAMEEKTKLTISVKMDYYNPDSPDPKITRFRKYTQALSNDFGS